MSQQSILDLSYQSFLVYLESIGEKSFRAQQIFDWIYKKSVCDFEKMKNISSDFCQKLSEDLGFPMMECVDEVKDDTGTRKFLFQLGDGKKIETVLISAPQSTGWPIKYI